MMEEMEYIVQQSREIKGAADAVRELGRDVIVFKMDVEDAWRSPDSKCLRDAADRLSDMLNHISAELYEIAHDVLICAQDFESQNGAEEKDKE